MFKKTQLYFKVRVKNGCETGHVWETSHEINFCLRGSNEQMPWLVVHLLILQYTLKQTTANTRDYEGDLYRRIVSCVLLLRCCQQKHKPFQWKPHADAHCWSWMELSWSRFTVLPLGSNKSYDLLCYLTVCFRRGKTLLQQWSCFQLIL